MLKKYFIPPLVPVCCLILLCIWVIIDETGGPVRMIDGSSDNAPRNAAGILLFIFSPILYVISMILNAIDTLYDRFRRPYNWLLTGMITVGLSLLFFPVFYHPKVDISSGPGIMTVCCIAVFLIWPMSLLRRLVFSRGKQIEAEAGPLAKD